MAGVTINLSGNTQTETENQWGITPKSLFCPPPTTGKPGYQSYTWRLYFLPASPQWVAELLAYSTDASIKALVDPNSQPWRIVYEVAAYQYVDASGNTTNYPPANPPDVSQRRRNSANPYRWQRVRGGRL